MYYKIDEEIGAVYTALGHKLCYLLSLLWSFDGDINNVSRRNNFPRRYDVTQLLQNADHERVGLQLISNLK